MRSATQVDAELIARADQLRVIGRAGVGVDNVDVAAATRRGILVCNAPQSNIVSAAEHTIALLLALARNVPQAHAALVEGRWERSRFGGVELDGKTLGVLGFGRIGQLVAARARGLGMRILAYDPHVTRERFRELGVASAASVDEVYESSDFITLHLPLTAETHHLISHDALVAHAPGRPPDQRRAREPGRHGRARRGPARRAHRRGRARRVRGGAAAVRLAAARARRTWS